MKDKEDDSPTIEKSLSQKRMLIRNSYEPPGHSLRLDGRKVHGLIDEYVRSLNIEGVLDQREVTYNNFLGYAAKFKSDLYHTVSGAHAPAKTMSKDRIK